jgi:hypothetical protein
VPNGDLFSENLSTLLSKVNGDFKVEYSAKYHHSSLQLIYYLELEFLSWKKITFFTNGVFRKTLVLFTYFFCLSGLL